MSQIPVNENTEKERIMEHRILHDLLKAITRGGPGSLELTATATGFQIPSERAFAIVTPTWVAVGNILILPPPVPGVIVVIAGAATGGGLQSSAPSTIAINGGTGAAAKSAVAASQMVVAICESSSSWKALTIASNGTVAGLPAAA